MIKYHIKSNKTVSLVRDEPVYITENKISSFKISLDATFCNYPIEELQFEMRCYLPPEQGSESDYISYMLNIENRVAEVPITNDITEKPQIVKIIFFATKDGNVIGKTNVIEKKIEDAPLKGEPLTPRAQFDEVIAEQRQTIQTQGETITSQGETITQQGQQISELNGEVTELTTENTRLEALTDTQRETIQNMLDNPPQPKLETPEIVTPSGIVQQITPDTEEGYVGLTSVTVDRVTADCDPDIQPQNIKEGVEILGVEGTYNPFPYNSVGGIYITEVDEDGYPVKFLVKDYERTLNPFPIFFDKSTNAVRALEEIVFENCPQIIALPDSYFSSLTYLEKVTLPEKLQIIPTNAFANCINLKNIVIPQETIRIKTSAFDGAGIIDLIVPSNVSVIEQYAFRRNSSLKTVILEHGVSYLAGRLFDSDSNLSYVYFPNTITFIGDSLFLYVTSLENVELENGFNCNGLNLLPSTLYSHDTILSWFNALADRTGETAYTLTIGSTNLNKVTAEEKAIAINKNWNLA